jgi:hypothetical protein
MAGQAVVVAQTIAQLPSVALARQDKVMPVAPLPELKIITWVVVVVQAQ